MVCLTSKSILAKPLLIIFLSLRGKKERKQKKKKEKINQANQYGKLSWYFLNFLLKKGDFFKGSAIQLLEQRGHDSWAPFPPPSPIHFMTN